MREILFILVVVFVLSGLTAFRYRRQIRAVFRFAQMLKDGHIDRQISGVRKSDPMAAEPLVKCSRCGTWVPENRARRTRSGDLFCSAECFELRAKAA